MTNSPARENIYSLLEQAGPFSTGDNPPSTIIFSREAKGFANDINAHGMVTKYRMIRNQVFEFLDVKNFAEIQLLLNNKKLAKHRKRGQQVGTGYPGSKNCLFREINRGVEWIFSNNASELQSIIRKIIETGD